MLLPPTLTYVVAKDSQFVCFIWQDCASSVPASIFTHYALVSQPPRDNLFGLGDNTGTFFPFFLIFFSLSPIALFGSSFTAKLACHEFPIPTLFCAPAGVQPAINPVRVCLPD